VNLHVSDRGNAVRSYTLSCQCQQLASERIFSCRSVLDNGPIRGEKPFERCTREMYETMNPQTLRQRREEMLREAERSRMVGALPPDR
jgi:hypothetical protein